MIVLSPYAARVVQRINFIGTWVTVVVCYRNFMICLAQYKRSKGKIHLVNMAQVLVIFLHRILYGIIPLFEITTCAYFPLLVSLWHLAYILFYVVMFQRLIILEGDHHSRWIKVVGLLLIAVRFADWPYELAVHEIGQKEAGQLSVYAVGTCWAQWQIGVLILNFIGDAIANLFLSGMFVRRLYKHIRSTQSSTPQNQMIEYIARKSLTCLALTFFVNLAMNLLKVTTFIGEYSDAFTVFFELAESTLLVEALRVDDQLKATVGCSQCGKSSGQIEKRYDQNPSQKRSRLPQFGTFDFVPLEERHSTSDVYRKNTNSDPHHPHITSYSTNTTTATGGRRGTNTMDDSTRMRFSVDSTITSPERSATRHGNTSTLSKRSMDITSHGSYSADYAAPNPSTSTQLQSSGVTRPLDTLSRSLVHHPEWNNNDYRMA